MTASAAKMGGISTRARAFRDLHFYQKWCAVWPHLAGLPHEDVRLLDAGCGDGAWSAEIARRRPRWTITGIDRDAQAIGRARARAERERHVNTAFEVSDFAAFVPTRPFDVVLSICSTHYGPTRLDSRALFERMRGWLAPSGQLVLLVPRCADEAPFVKPFDRPQWHRVFTREDLTQLCDEAGLTADLIAPSIGRVGTMAKQLDWARAEMSPAAGRVVGALARGVAMVDACLPQQPARSLMWLVIARPRTHA